jgi:uncharacterized protein YqeY
MLELMKKLKTDLVGAMTKEIEIRKTSDSNVDHQTMKQCIAQKTVSRAIISMCPEIKKKPNDATDDDVITLLKRYISNEKERQLYVDRYITEADVQDIDHKDLKKLVTNKMQELGDKLTSPLIKIAQGYLPKQETEEEVVQWIKDNVDMDSFKNKMQAMGPVMKNFKGADGNFIKTILLKMV